MDNFFSSLSLENKLIRNKSSLAGTMNKARWELTLSAQNALAQLFYSTTVVKNDKTTLTLYQCKARNNISVVSTIFPTAAIDRT